MKITISLFLISLLLTSVSAEVQKISVQDFSFHYDGHNGQGSFSKISMNTDTINFEAEDYQIGLQKSPTHLIVTKSDTRVKLQTAAGDLISSLGQIEIDGLNINMIRNSQFNVSLLGADLEIGDGSHHIKHVNLRCQSGNSRNGDVLSFLLPCMKDGFFSIPEIVLSSESKKSISEALNIDAFKEKFLSEHEDFKASGLIPKKIKDVQLHIKNNRFNLNAKVKVLFNLKIKGSGQIYYHAQNSELEINLSLIKLGFIKITKKVLKAIRKANLQNVRVSGHSVFVSL